MDLSTFWFILIAVLWTGYFVLEGFDFGVGMLFAILGRGADKERRRRVLLNTIGPVWDGNEVWLVTAAGATFAAFPLWYSTMFSGFYLLLLAVLVGLIVRVLAFDYRGKRDDPAWRRRWDAAIIAGSLTPAFLWGVIFTDMVRGVPIDAAGEYTGGLLDLLGPVALLGGVTTTTLFLLHGLFFVALKTDGEIRADARGLATRLAVPVVVLVAATSWAIAGAKPAPLIAAAAAVVALLVSPAANLRGREGLAFTGTFAAIGLFVAALFLGLWPDVMPSSSNPAWSLTVDGAASSPLTLTIMSWVAGLLTPLVLLYQGWTYWVFRRRISAAQIPEAREPTLASDELAPTAPRE